MGKYVNNYVQGVAGCLQEHVVKSKYISGLIPTDYICHTVLQAKSAPQIAKVGSNI